jgi:hypothetical protein
MYKAISGKDSSPSLLSQQGARSRIGHLLATGVLTLTVAAPSASTAAAEAASDQVTICLVRTSAPKAERTITVAPAGATRLLHKTLSYRGPCAAYGDQQALGNGTIRTYAQRTGDKPLALGVAFPKSMLAGLPTNPPNDGKHCFDGNKDGRLDPHTECEGGHERVSTLPQTFRDTVDAPFTWALTNWNPRGHVPAGVYDVSHFDFHFYLTPLADRNRIRPGPCGGLVHCDDFARGRVPVPAAYRPPGYTDQGAVVVAMGNHLGDGTSPEFHGTPFTHTFIYGAYDGKITFYELMITKAFFQGMRDGTSPDTCQALKLPKSPCTN